MFTATTTNNAVIFVRGVQGHALPQLCHSMYLYVYSMHWGGWVSCYVVRLGVSSLCVVVLPGFNSRSR